MLFLYMHIMCDSISNDQGEQRICTPTHTGSYVYDKIAQLLQEEAKHLNCILSVLYICKCTQGKQMAYA